MNDNNLKDIYNSIKAPDKLYEKTLNAIEEEKKKPLILKLNYKPIMAVAACFIFVLGLTLSGVFNNDSIKLSSIQGRLSEKAVYCTAENIDYQNNTSDKAKGLAGQNDLALKITVKTKDDVQISSNKGRLALKTDAEISKIANNATASGEFELYIIPDNEERISVTLTHKNEVKTINIKKNADETYSIRTNKK